MQRCAVQKQMYWTPNSTVHIFLTVWLSLFTIKCIPYKFPNAGYKKCCNYYHKTQEHLMIHVNTLTTISWIVCKESLRHGHIQWWSIRYHHLTVHTETSFYIPISTQIKCHDLPTWTFYYLFSWKTWWLIQLNETFLLPVQSTGNNQCVVLHVCYWCVSGKHRLWLLATKMSFSQFHSTAL